MTKRRWQLAVVVAAVFLDAGAWWAPHWNVAGRLATTGAIIVVAAIFAAIGELND